MKTLLTNKNTPFPQRTLGFTLVELLLVVAIIGILAAVAVPRFFGRSKEARITAARQEIVGTLGLALDLYEQDEGEYPSQDEGLEALLRQPSSATNWRGPYLKANKIPLDPWGTSYHYVYPSQMNINSITAMYDLISAGPDKVLGTDDDISNYQ